MSTRKLKQHRFEDRLKYMQLLEEGYSFSYISQTYGINSAFIKVLWHRYQAEGIAGLHKQKQVRPDFALKKRIILEIEEKHLPLHVASSIYGFYPSTIGKWLKCYREGGFSALERVNKRGRPSTMGRPKKNSQPLTELERLQKENQELKTQIALLKKVKALVEEREARLKEIGRKPSKS